MFIRETTGPHPEPNNSAKMQAVRDNSYHVICNIRGRPNDAEPLRLEDQPFSIIREETFSIIEATGPSGKGLQCSWFNDSLVTPEIPTSAAEEPEI